MPFSWKRCVTPVRNHLRHQVDEARNGIALDVELRREHTFQIAHVVVTDMARIGTRMHRDAVGSETLDVQGCANHVGQVAAARIAHHGDLIDVNAQLCHKIHSIKEIQAPVRTSTNKFGSSLTFHYICSDMPRLRAGPQTPASRIRIGVVKLLIFSKLRR